VARLQREFDTGSRGSGLQVGTRREKTLKLCETPMRPVG